MSRQLISRSPDLQRLRDEGYDIEVRSSYLLVKNVPYVNSKREVRLGTLVSELCLAGDATASPNTHVVHFAGEYPCDKNGSEIGQIRHGSGTQTLAEGIVVQHSFSSKPDGGYGNYYDKMATYAAIVSGPAQSINPTVTPRPHPITVPEDEESVFNYLDTASSRAGICAVTRKLAVGKIAIVGVGGTGSYVLDLVAKTPVREIHLFDGDTYYNHNAFRSPGAPSVDELRTRPLKVVYFAEKYSKMHRHIVPHEDFLDASNVDQLEGMSFVFVCLDGGSAKRVIVEKLEALGTSFIDVGMGVELVDDKLHGILRVTTSTADNREHVRNRNRITFSGGAGDNPYSTNIQIADLNALNATLAVIKWKKLLGFYGDLDHEHYTTYTIDGNSLINEDKA